jgi:hypothetical protein
MTNLKQELPVAAMFVNLKVPGTLIVLCMVKLLMKSE